MGRDQTLTSVTRLLNQNDRAPCTLTLNLCQIEYGNCGFRFSVNVHITQRWKPGVVRMLKSHDRMVLVAWCGQKMERPEEVITGEADRKSKGCPSTCQLLRRKKLNQGDILRKRQIGSGGEGSVEYDQIDFVRIQIRIGFNESLSGPCQRIELQVGV